MIGYEAIRDAYTLAKGQFLICGLSNLSSFSRIIKEANHEKFDKLIIISNGINK